MVEHFAKNTNFQLIVLDKLSYASKGYDRLRNTGVFHLLQTYCVDLCQVRVRVRVRVTVRVRIRVRVSPHPNLHPHPHPHPNPNPDPKQPIPPGLFYELESDQVRDRVKVRVR